MARAAREVRARRVRANGLDFGLLEAGDSGPLALCLHGFPDTADTFRHLLPRLAAAGFHAVAPFMRGYAPTAVPADGCYTMGALVADVVALHEVLGGDEQAVLVGHDWGAEAAYVAAADMAFIERLWRDWSPGFNPTEQLAFVKESLREPAHRKAAIDYYRVPSGAPLAYQAKERAAGQRPPQPTLFMYGANDGCIRAQLLGETLDALAPGSRSLQIPDAGHFLHLEQPVEVNSHVVSWLTD